MNKNQDIATPTRTKEILEKHGFSFKKSLGQNFLTDPNILRNIVQAAGVDETTSVIEVGPGIGALTEVVARQAKEVLAVEIDQRLIPVLEDTLSPYKNIEVINEDILSTDISQLVNQYFKEVNQLKVVANLPYYITTPIIMHFLESAIDVDEMVIMMQKEVAERLSAKPSTKAYGSLSIAVQYYMDVEIAFIVPKTVFVPQPNVDSAIVKLTKKENPEILVQDEALFFRIVKASFAQRRKTLWNNLRSHFGKEEETLKSLEKALVDAGIDPKRRGESLTIKEFGQLSDEIAKQKKLVI